MILPDILQRDLDIVFCGTAAGNKSAERKAYYAGRGNLFYLTLASCGFTPHVLRSDEFPELLNYKIGLTDLAKFAHGMDSKLRKKDYDVNGFEEKILKYQPKIVCFNGKKAAMVYFRLTKTKYVSYGEQSKLIGKTKIFVAPSTSSAGRKYWDENIWWQLKKYVK